MFSYYGTKRSLAAKYPAPRHDLIVEPFAGAAAYACVYPDRDVWLLDLDPIVVATWEYLITATPQDIQQLPNLEPGDKVSRDLPDGARYLMGFEANPGSTQPKITASQRSHWARRRTAIASQVSRIKHWQVSLLSWTDVPNVTATWFVDPPYQRAGKWYRHGSTAINFNTLGQFCRTRWGQTIVCENAGADWLPFQPFSRLQGSRKPSTEVVWYGDCKETL